MYLALLSPFLSLGVTVATITMTILITLAAPFRLCFRALPPFKIRLTNYLWPLISIHHRCVHSVPFASPPPSAPGSPLHTQQHAQSEPKNERTGSIGILLIVLLLCPIVALPFMLAAWIIGCFWVLSMLVKDERTQDPHRRRNEDDGHMLARILISWWIKWLDGGR